MSALLLTDRYLPHSGGSRRYYHELAVRMPDTTVLTGHYPGEEEFDRTSPVPIVRRAGIRPNYAVRAGDISNPVLNVLLSYVPGILAMLWWTLVEILRSRPRVIHAGGYAFAGVAARIWGPVFGIPYFVYAHGEDVSTTSQRRFFRHYMVWVFEGAFRVVAGSQVTVRYLLHCGIDPAAILLANPGLHLRFEVPESVLRLRSERLREAGSAADSAGVSPVLLSVGRLVEHKGQAIVIRALPALLERWPDLLYRVVGKGPRRERLEELAKDLGVDGNVEFCGEVTEEQLKEIYLSADLFVQPNYEVEGAFEGYGIVYLEAGSAGLAVIGGRSGGVPESVVDGTTGVLVPPADPAAVAATVESLLVDHDERDRLARAGRERAQRRTYDHTMSNLLEVNRRVVEGINSTPQGAGA